MKELEKIKVAPRQGAAKVIPAQFTSTVRPKLCVSHNSIDD